MPPHSVRVASIVFKAGNGDAEALGREIGAWLAQRGATAVCSSFDGCFEEFVRDPAHPPDIVISVGGDGTMLSACRIAAGTGIPVLGVNRGNLGFLAEADAENWRTALTRILEGDFAASPRLLLEASVLRNGGEVHIARRETQPDTALNEICLARGSLARVMTFELFINGEAVGTIRADGVIFSTPTGATGYSVSAGGPLVLPEMDAFTVTPICPFLSSFPPLVVNGNARARVIVKNAGGGVLATLDGHDSLALMEGDEVRIRKFAAPVLLAALPGFSYFSVLRTKGFIRA